MTQPSEGISDNQVVPVPSHSQLSAQNESLRQKLAAAEATIAELKGALREFVTANYPPNQPILSKDEVLYFADKFLAALSTHTEEKP